LSSPLAGRHVVVTRARQQAGKLTQSLRELGAEVTELPVIEIVPPESYAPLDEALGKLNSYQWLIVTSANAVRALGERLALLGLSTREFASLKTVAVGSATADAMRKQGMDVDLVPEKYVAESVIASLAAVAPGTKILLARAHIARDVIPEALRSSGAQVDIVDAYQTIVPAGSEARIRELFGQVGHVPDAVTFTSSSTVSNFVALLKESGIAVPPPGVRALSIGPITSTTLREHGWEPFAEAEVFDVAGLVSAVVSAFEP
jgi:uroporphyrinogen-III synthase